MATRFQLVLAAGLLAAMAASLLHATCRAPRIAFLRQHEVAPWIASPEPPTAGILAAPYAELPAVEFATRFPAPAGGAALELELQALRGFELEVNGRPLAARAWDEGDWRKPTRVALREGLAARDNHLVVRVRNPDGPPLLRLRGEGGGVRLTSGANFAVRRGDGPLREAVRADDQRRAPAALLAPRLTAMLEARALALVGVAALALAGGAALTGAGAGPTRARLRRLGPLALALFGAALFANAVSLPAYVGFDGPDHLAYVRFVLTERAFPLATQGPQMYHPPLFHALAAAVLGPLEALGVPERVALRPVPFAAAATQVAVAFALARSLFPADRGRAALAAAAAALLPVNVYTAAYVGNEPVHGALAGLALLVAVGALRRGAAPGWALGAGALAGLAALTKASSLLLVPLLAGALAALPLLAGLRRGAGRAAAAGAAVLAGAAAACGWYYLRNQLVFGRAVFGNWDVPGAAVAWWQPPGFHTASYYLHFGSWLERPFFAGFASFFDGLYTTAFGDGLIGGIAAWPNRHAAFDWELMGGLYVLGLPALVLVAAGGVGLARESLRGEDLGRRAALTLLVTAVAVTIFATLFMTLVLPAYSMAKASYALSLTAPLALAAADGFARADRAWAARGWRAPRVLLHAWALAFAMLVVGTFAL